MDQFCFIVLAVLPRRLDFVLLALFAPTVYYNRQEGQIDFIFIVQLDFARLDPALQILQARTLALSQGRDC